MRRHLKTGIIVFCAVVLTTLGISASDTLQGMSGSLLSMALESQEVHVGCPTDMAEVTVGSRRLCVDLFEASTASVCPKADPQNAQETERNMSTGGCMPVSKKDAKPWRFINQSQAQRACALAGKRLPSNEEWYRAALGTPSGTAECNLNTPQSQEPRISRETNCKSTIGTYDMIGNVWEWVDESVTEGTYRARPIPQTGYVSGVDVDGVVLTSATTEDELYGKDYAWTSASGVRGMIRGGFYGSGEDGGLYTLNTSIDLAFMSPGVGFRCVRDYEQ
jgi:formylglycine-generating enzyme required for sulfatase activity